MGNTTGEHRNEIPSQSQATADSRRRVCLEILRSSTISQRALLRMLALAELRGLDAAELVSALATEFPGSTGAHMKRLAQTLSSGVPPVDAVGQVHRVLDESAVLALRLARDSGSLTQLQEVILASTDVHDSAVDSQEIPGLALLRVGAWFFFATLLMTFLALFIVPTFEMLFDEFGLTLPGPTLLMIEIAESFPVFFALVLCLLIIYVTVQSPAIVTVLMQRADPLDGGRQLLPVRSKILSLLAITFHSGHDFVTGLAAIARHHPSSRLRRRLERACYRIDTGSPPWGALAAEKLVSRREARALSEAATPQTQAWILNWSITARQRRKSARAGLFVRTVTVGSTVLLGAIVALTTVSVYMVLVELITGLT